MIFFVAGFKNRTAAAAHRRRTLTDPPPPTHPHPHPPQNKQRKIITHGCAPLADGCARLGRDYAVMPNKERNAGNFLCFADAQW